MALSVAHRAQTAVLGYQRLADTVIAGEKKTDIRAYPLTDKRSYIQPHTIQALLSREYGDTFSIFRSSGSTGRPCYWPQLKRSHRLTTRAFQIYLESCFGIHEKRTLAIVGLSLGSWIGGDQFSFLFKQSALQVPYPFGVFSPGNRYDEILDILRDVDPFVEQILLALCPSAIGHLFALAHSRGIVLPVPKLRYLVIGEPFSESVRVSLSKAAGCVTPVLFSMYGSADTGVLGVESKGSIALRQLLSKYATLRGALGIGSDIPHFFHVCAPDAFIETVEDELCVTRWQGIPIVRYNLHDHATLFSWKKIRALVLSLPDVASEDAFLISQIATSTPYLSPTIALYGRTDQCLMLCGTNITGSMLETVFQSQSLTPYLTGMYYAKLEYDAENRQFLSLDVELKSAHHDMVRLDQNIYTHFVSELSQVQPEFEGDWQNMYSEWDADPERRIVRIRYHVWPALSKEIESKTKHVGIQK